MSLPLVGQTILVTRPAHQMAGLADPLTALGATVLALPAIAIAPPLDPGPFDDALRNLDAVDWIVVTSVNGVEALENRADSLNVRNEVCARRLAAVGPSTAKALAEAFRAPDFVPEEHVGESLAEGIGDVAGRRFLLPRADIARPELPRVLRERGGIVQEVAAYRIVRPEAAALPERRPDVIALTSSSAVHGTRDALAAAGKESWMREARLACIGPITAATVRELGYRVALMADEYTIPGLVDALVREAALHDPRPLVG